MMAITHSIAHLFPNQASNASALLQFVNQHLSAVYTRVVESFVTAFYGIFDAKTRELQYSTAGHNPPRLVRCGTKEALALDQATSLPLGVLTQTEYFDVVVQLRPGDRVVLYTDGITEAMDPHRQIFGVDRLDKVIEHTCGQSSECVIQAILSAVDEFTEGAKATDDRTLLVANVS
jgi:sigma-B regulation protein RsbU (phosphoserine phosphatase)